MTSWLLPVYCPVRTERYDWMEEETIYFLTSHQGEKQNDHCGQTNKEKQTCYFVFRVFTSILHKSFTQRLMETFIYSFLRKKCHGRRNAALYFCIIVSWQPIKRVWKMTTWLALKVAVQISSQANHKNGWSSTGRQPVWSVGGQQNDLNNSNLKRHPAVIWCFFLFQWISH